MKSIVLELKTVAVIVIMPLSSVGLYSQTKSSEIGMFKSMEIVYRAIDKRIPANDRQNAKKEPSYLAAHNWIPYVVNAGITNCPAVEKEISGHCFDNERIAVLVLRGYHFWLNGKKKSLLSINEELVRRGIDEPPPPEPKHE